MIILRDEPLVVAVVEQELLDHQRRPLKTAAQALILERCPVAMTEGWSGEICKVGKAESNRSMVGIFGR